MKKKIKIALLALSIIILPYVFILLMGVLNKEGLISTRWSFLIVLGAVIIMIIMMILLIQNLKVSKKKVKNVEIKR